MVRRDKIGRKHTATGFSARWITVRAQRSHQIKKWSLRSETVAFGPTVTERGRSMDSGPPFPNGWPFSDVHAARRGWINEKGWGKHLGSSILDDLPVVIVYEYSPGPS